MERHAYVVRLLVPVCVGAFLEQGRMFSLHAVMVASCGLEEGKTRQRTVLETNS